MNEGDIGDGEMKQLQSVSNLENPFKQGFHLAQALRTVHQHVLIMKRGMYNKHTLTNLNEKNVIHIAIEVCNAPCNDLCNILSSTSLCNNMVCHCVFVKSFVCNSVRPTVCVQ